MEYPFRGSAWSATTPRHESTVSIEEAARRLELSKRSVYYRIREGELRTVRVGRSQRVLTASLETVTPRGMRFPHTPSFRFVNRSFQGQRFK